MRPQDWDERHADDTRRWSGAASPRLVAEIDGLPPGRALDLACGQGRNAVWLAERGWSVTAVDFSPVGLAKARARAAELGVDVDWVESDLLEFEPEPAAYDLALVFYLHVSQPDRGTVLRTAARALAPGGTFLLVGHDRANLGHGHGGPRDPRVLYTTDEIAADLSGLRVERTEQLARPVETDDGERVALDLLVRATRSGS